MQFPLLAKPYITDGRQGSHGLALVHSLEGLKQLVNGTGPPGVALPVMLQPFIEHGGCLFKVDHSSRGSFVSSKQSALIMHPA